ncbi:MAG: hypothetical protein ACOH2T_29235 [Pseudomonas sp.]
MANKEISELTPASLPLDRSELVHVIQAGNSRKATIFDLGDRGFSTTATAAGTTTLTGSSNEKQYFTGTTTQTVALPVTSTLVLGQSFHITNNSTGIVTVNSSGGNAVQAVAPGATLEVVCILTTGTTAASWSANYQSANAFNSFQPIPTSSTNLPVGSVILAFLATGSVANNATIAGTSLVRIVINGTNGTLNGGAALSGTWTSIAGETLTSGTTSAGGYFVRTA